MEMNGPTITKELKNDIEVNQIQLQNAIRNHQVSFRFASSVKSYCTYATGPSSLFELKRHPHVLDKTKHRGADWQCLTT